MMDPTGFLDLLNRTRLGFSLGAVAWDDDLAAGAAENNRLQAEQGQGHWTHQNVWQCAFVGPKTARDALDGFLADGAHRRILLRGNLTRCGTDCRDGHIWTVNLV